MARRYDIIRDRARNRVYFRPPQGLYVPGARHDGDRQWFGVGDAPRDLAAYLDELAVQICRVNTARAQYQAVLATIPTDYRRRHGALYGGDVLMDGQVIEVIVPPVLGLLHRADWREMAGWTELGTTGLCAGRVRDRDMLQVMILPDARAVYREIHYRGYGDDQRETYHFPADVFAVVIGMEIAARKITHEAAREWLAEYRGCVDTELYEAALALAASKGTAGVGG